jgi:hypothetical protein
MKSLARYHRQPHADNCDCSVCYVKRNWVSPRRSSHWGIYPSTQCTDCRPARWSLENGRATFLSPAFTCEKHKPGSRPPRYWHVVSDTGKPTPFVPLREPFELVG